MQVKISFDTENESLDNLKKLVEALQKLIAHREGKPISQETKKEEPKKNVSKTGGGCRVIPYEDMSGKMAELLSGRRF
ncbi:hypothetical protein HN681_00705 [archaeon]|jgi:hypothetical protein|nr:hypothetical protein [archaeon]MBT3731067.1 hypothetical protein [archaeon]MBT4670180.1 hypothetical protein [archaeon]MBT5030530.1 hypothetical protein [archaeon]MBT5287883.1 hypothetical protein [archaeon]